MMKRSRIGRGLTRALRLAGIVVVFLFMAGCASSSGEKSTPSGAPPAAMKGAPPSISEIYDNPAAFDGRVVEMTGRFMGWTGCRAPTRMATRSDWTLADDETCIYVSGGFPQNLRPRNKKDMDREVRIKGMVIRDGDRVHLRMVGEKR